MQTQKSIIRQLLETSVDTSMNVTLARVLTAGQKFSYIYDYGSSTHINLRVAAEREWIVQNEEEPVQLLARNTAPAFSCKACGRPATKIEANYFTNALGDAYCDKCAGKINSEEAREMPIINSPRVGVL